jgi:hypothetical protein
MKNDLILLSIFKIDAIALQRPHHGFRQLQGQREVRGGPGELTKHTTP